MTVCDCYFFSFLLPGVGFVRWNRGRLGFFIWAHISC
jgi:hypothetical protein